MTAASHARRPRTTPAREEPQADQNSERRVAAQADQPSRLLRDACADDARAREATASAVVHEIAEAIVGPRRRLARTLGELELLGPSPRQTRRCLARPLHRLLQHLRPADRPAVLGILDAVVVLRAAPEARRQVLRRVEAVLHDLPNRDTNPNARRFPGPAWKLLAVALEPALAEDATAWRVVKAAMRRGDAIRGPVADLPTFQDEADTNRDSSSRNPEEPRTLP